MGDFAKKKWKENLNYQREKSTAHMVDSWQVLHGKTLKVLPFREGARQRFHYCHLNSAQSKVRNYKLRLLNKFETLKGLHPQGKGIQRKVYSLAQRNQEKYLPLYLNRERASLRNSQPWTYCICRVQICTIPVVQEPQSQNQAYKLVLDQ